MSTISWGVGRGHSRGRRRALLGTALVCALFSTAAAEGLQGLLAEGARLFHEKKYPRAEETFARALELYPDSADARRNLANTRAAQGQELLRGGRYDEAKARTEAAIELIPGEGGFHALLALILLRTGDLYGARWEIDKALDSGDGAENFLEISGDIHYQEGDLSRAVDDWERARDSAPRRAEALAAKIDRAEKELRAESSFDREVSRHFTLQYDGDGSAELGPAVLRLLEDAYERIGDELGSYPEADIPVIIYPNLLFHEVTASPAWASGTFDGKIRVPAGGLSGGEAAALLGPILAHELTHAFLRSMAPRGLPLWFEEGVAKYFEGMDADRAATCVESHGVAFDSFDAVDRGLRGRGGDVIGAYCAASLAVHLLVEDEGLWTLRRIVEEVGRGTPFPVAFSDEARLDLTEFQEDWLRALPR